MNLGAMLREVGVLEYPEVLNAYTLPHKPFPHQMEVLKQYTRSQRFLDAGEPGTGKTLPAQAHGILMASLGNKVVYTMPPKILDQFMEEMRDWFVGIDNHLKLGSLNVPAAKKEKLTDKWNSEGWPDILFLSYDGYREWNDIADSKKVGRNQWYQEDGTKWEKGQAFTKDGREINRAGYAKNNKKTVLTKQGYNVYFFDEAHYLCGTDSIISQSVQETVGDECAMYLMTGTPIPTNLLNAYGIVSLINPEAYSSFRSFERQHCIKKEITIQVKGRGKTVQVPFKFIGHDKVHEAMFKYGKRTLKRDVTKLPKPIITSIPVRLSKQHLKAYKDFMNNMMAELESTIITAENHSQLRHMSLKLISCPTSFDPELSMKNDLFFKTKELVESINPKENKIVIFAYYRDAIEFLAEEFKEFNPAILYGGSNTNEIDRFKKDDDCRIIIANWVSGGAGLNLQMASHIIFYECPTSPKDAKQAIARCDRTGQLNLVNAYFMRVLKTLSDKNFRKLLEAEEDLNKAVKDDKDLLYKVLG